MLNIWSLKQMISFGWRENDGPSSLLLFIFSQLWFCLTPGLHPSLRWLCHQKSSFCQYNHLGKCFKMIYLKVRSISRGMDTQPRLHTTSAILFIAISIKYPELFARSFFDFIFFIDTYSSVNYKTSKQKNQYGYQTSIARSPHGSVCRDEFLIFRWKWGSPSM